MSSTVPDRRLDPAWERSVRTARPAALSRIRIRVFTG